MFEIFDYIQRFNFSKNNDFHFSNSKLETQTFHEELNYCSCIFSSNGDVKILGFVDYVFLPLNLSFKILSEVFFEFSLNFTFIITSI